MTRRRCLTCPTVFVPERPEFVRCHHCAALRRRDAQSLRRGERVAEIVTCATPGCGVLLARHTAQRTRCDLCRLEARRRTWRDSQRRRSRRSA